MDEFKVEDVVLAWNQTMGSPDEVSLTIKGPPGVQNGWKMAHRGMRSKPVIYDPRKAMKSTLRSAIRNALRQLGERVFPFFRDGPLKMCIIFGMNNILSKDIDNMAKFLLDSLQGALYSNDRFVVSTLISKVPSHGEEYTIVSISKLHIN